MFKVGQIIRCVDSGSNSGIVNGDLYKVHSISGNFHYIYVRPLIGEWIDGYYYGERRGYFSKRFKEL